MPNTAQGTKDTFIEVDYAAKVVFTPQPESRVRPDLRTIWQQSQGLWRDHPVFHNLPIGDVMVWLRGEDSDV